jgi:hypothetical protein
MLASAKSKAHQAFKNGNYLVAARIYDEVYSHLAWLIFWNGGSIIYGLIDQSEQVYWL